MIHSRPGFAPRFSDKAVSRLNEDMIPAINRKPLASDSNLKEDGPVAAQHQLDARTEAAMAKLAKEHPPADILVNPHPSEPPKVLEPGK